MKTKIKIIKSVILSVIFLLLLISFSITYAWYTRTSLIGKLDAETKDITFSYKINGGKTNPISYSITNLAFFDPEAHEELKYFVDMHTVIKIELENFSTDEVHYYIQFNSTKVKTENSVAYVMGIITTSKNLDIVDDGNNTVGTYFNYDTSSDTYSFTYNSEANLEINDGSNAKAKATLYLHLIGVQENPLATNNFLFDAEGNPIAYSFNLVIHSEPVNNDPIVTEVTQTTTA